MPTLSEGGVGGAGLGQMKMWYSMGLYFHAVCIFDKVSFFASLLYLTRKYSHKNKMHVNWHTRFIFWHVVWLAKKKNHTSIDTIKIGMTHTTRHVTSGRRFRKKENCKCHWHSLLFFKTSHDTSNLKWNVKWSLSNIHTVSIMPRYANLWVAFLHKYNNSAFNIANSTTSKRILPSPPPFKDLWCHRVTCKWQSFLE